MRRFISLLIPLLICNIFCCVGHNTIVFNSPLHHIPIYGEKGEDLFPIDENGFAIMTGIVECPGKSVDEIMNSVLQWLNYMMMFQRLEVDDNEKYQVRNQLIFKGKLRIGNKEIGFGTVFGPDVMWNTSETDLSFIAKIDIKDGKFRYTFSHLIADRYRISGFGETSGALNDIHWQRRNCLLVNIKEEKDKLFPDKEDIQEYEMQLKYDEYLYQAEYDTMVDMINRLKDSQKEEDFDF